MTGDPELDLARERYRRGPEPAPGYRTRGGSAAFLGKVVTAAGPGKFLTVNPVVVTGAETAGGPPSYAVDTTPLLAAFVAGAGTPAAGDYLVCRWAGYRWVTEGAGAGGPSVVVTWHTCSGAAFVGATVTAAGPGGATAGPATTDGVGRSSLALPAAGGWTFTATKSGAVTQTATFTFTGAPGQTATVDYSASAPATATLTTLGQAVPMTLGLGGTFSGVLASYPVGTSYDVVFPNCVAATTAEFDFFVSCPGTGFPNQTRHEGWFVSCSSPGANDWAANPAASTSANTVSAATITSYSVTPFLITGVWGAAWDNAGTYPASPFAGATFTLS